MKDAALVRETIVDSSFSQIAAQYGPNIANEAFSRSSTNLNPAHRQSLSLPGSRNASTQNLAGVSTSTSGGLGLTRPTSRFAPSTHSTGYNSQSGLYDPSRSSFDDASRLAPPLTPLPGGAGAHLAGMQGGSSAGGTESRLGSRDIDTETEAADTSRASRYTEGSRYTDDEDWDGGYYSQPGQPDYTQSSQTEPHPNSNLTGWAR